MSQFLDIQVDPVQRRALERALSSAPGRLRRAERRAVNKTARGVRTDVSKSVREELALNAKAVKKTVRLITATGQSTSATVIISKRNVPLKEYKARETKSGVTVKVRKSQPREKYKHAFIDESLGNHVFQRRVDAGRPVPRLPILKLLGPSVYAVVRNQPGMLSGIEQRAGQTLGRRMREEVNFELRKLVRRR